MGLIKRVILSLGLLFAIAPAAQAQPADVQIGNMVEALKQAAPNTGNVNDELYSDWQVKPQTIKMWSKNCIQRELTPTQFESSPVIARYIISCIVRRELTQQYAATNNNETAAVRGTACWWMTGKYAGCDSGFTADYVKKVVEYYQKQGDAGNQGTSQ